MRILGWKLNYIMRNCNAASAIKAAKGFIGQRFGHKRMWILHLQGQALLLLKAVLRVNFGQEPFCIHTFIGGRIPCDFLWVNFQNPYGFLIACGIHWWILKSANQNLAFHPLTCQNVNMRIHMWIPSENCVDPSTK